MKYIFALLLLALPHFACAEGADNPHIRSAFTFAHRKMWTEAIHEAKAAPSSILAKYFTWEYLKDPEADASFEDITAFIADNPDWPDKATLLKRAEVALLAGNPSDETMASWFAKHPPITSMARLRKAKTPEELHTMIREAWVSDDYDKNTEKKILAKYHSVLRAQDHIRRIDRLLWEGRNEEAKRLLKYVPYDHQRLFQARISLAEDKQNAPIEVVNVPPALRKDPGLIYQRILWRMRSGDKDGVREMLLLAPDEVPYPEKWWPLRDRQIREALGEGNVKLATKLLVHHSQKTDSLSFKEVQWLSGWISLEYLHQPDKALANFTWLYKEAHTPAGKSRAAYWAGRASQENGKGGALHWFDDAAHYPTTFYGQVAAQEANPEAVMNIPTDAEPTAEARQHFRKRELVQLVLALGAAHETDAAARFIIYLTENAESADEAILATRLGGEINRIDFSVRASKKALQNGIIALHSGWPAVRFSHTQGLEVPLLLALSRQESEFFGDAVSPSGAVGLMQILPGTAKEIARKNDIRYSYDRLFNDDYNMTIGSIYLGKMLSKFNGSYILSIASYNAGPGRIGQWMDLYGRPGKTTHAALDWIERIPTTETRNYVQHVLENVQVYRFVVAGKPTHITIADDLVR